MVKASPWLAVLMITAALAAPAGADSTALVCADDPTGAQMCLYDDDDGYRACRSGGTGLNGCMTFYDDGGFDACGGDGAGLGLNGCITASNHMDICIRDTNYTPPKEIICLPVHWPPP